MPANDKGGMIKRKKGKLSDYNRSLTGVKEN